MLEAPPGAGKSTVVPLALLAESWMRGKRLILLEPRRLAARAVAERMAQSLGERVGATIGVRMRLDTRVSRDTRIEVVTEGVLTRILQSDPALEGIAMLIFDEFHERSLNADLGLALALDARANIAPDLKILVMSATLDGVAIARLLGDAPVVTAQGRMFPVQTRYAGKGAPVLPDSTPGVWDAPERAVVQLVRRAIEEESGDMLVFLPGAREIRRTQSLLQSGLDPSVRLLPLYGDMNAQDQDAALSPAKAGERKVILATNIAETSLTVEGVRIVIDSGLARRAAFDPATGMGRLETRRISRASADQRQGRGGRTAPGVCFRAWSEEAQRSLAAFTPPEIAQADLAPLALDLAEWGIIDAASLRWLDPPPAVMLASARGLLARLNAIDGTGRITAHGRHMARLGVHPRLAHMLLQGADLGALPLAADLAALLSERDLLRASRDADIQTRLALLRGNEARDGIDRGTLARARRLASELRRQLEEHIANDERDADVDAGVLLAFAYPDRIGRRRLGGEPRYTLANGRGAHFAQIQPVAREEFIVALDLDDRERDARILLAASLARGDIERYFGDRLETVERVGWDSREAAVIARSQRRLDALVVEEKPLPQWPTEAAVAAMLEGVRELGLAGLPWDRDIRDLQARMEFVRRLDVEAGWPAVDDAALMANLDAWLGPWLTGVTRRDHLSRVPLGEALRALLTYEQQRRLDALAPSHLTVPSGSTIRIDYLEENAPSLAVRLQEVFGLDQTPLLAGRIPIVFKLLSPAQRPVQVTRDLASFWRGAYADVRKDLRGRYPKHYWPEDPLQAEPRRGTRRNKPC